MSRGRNGLQLEVGSQRTHGLLVINMIFVKKIPVCFRQYQDAGWMQNQGFPQNCRSKSRPGGITGSSNFSLFVQPIVWEVKLMNPTLFNFRPDIHHTRHPPHRTSTTPDIHHLRYPPHSVQCRTSTTPNIHRIFNVLQNATFNTTSSGMCLLNNRLLNPPLKKQPHSHISLIHSLIHKDWPPPLCPCDLAVQMRCFTMEWTPYLSVYTNKH